MKKVLIFGATGSIGNHLVENYKRNGFEVIGTTSNLEKSLNNKELIYVDNSNLNNLLLIDEISIVIWAHGFNFSDSIINFDINNFTKMIDANVSFILNTLKILLDNNKIQDGGKLVIVSSIWEEFTRANKLSYTITKAALSGMVKNLAYDLSAKNILINNVLPGVIDNEMSQKALSVEQMNYVKNYLQFGSLITLDDVYKTIKFLTVENSGITGQSIKVDLGFTNFKKI
jgi:NAD(P)-dependent dehydrogenase (short-subunit alcohol dehydrogenase family)